MDEANTKNHARNFRLHIFPPLLSSIDETVDGAVGRTERVDDVVAAFIVEWLGI